MLFTEIMAGHDEKDSTTVRRVKPRFEFNNEPFIKGLKIGVPVEYNCEGLSDEVKETWRNTTKLLEEGGAVVKTVGFK